MFVNEEIALRFEELRETLTPTPYREPSILFPWCDHVPYLQQGISILS
jgi:hypothetical protein